MEQLKEAWAVHHSGGSSDDLAKLDKTLFCKRSTLLFRLRPKFRGQCTIHCIYIE